MKDILMSFVIPSFHKHFWNELAKSYVFKCKVNDFGRCCQYLISCNMQVHVSLHNAGHLNIVACRPVDR
jgi:hypothetical protein